MPPFVALRAARLMQSLPDFLPPPEVAGEPDGSISLDWIVSRDRLCSLSAGAGDRLAYAWVHGSTRGHGVERFDGTTIRPRILQAIRDVQKDDDESLGPA